MKLIYCLMILLCPLITVCQTVQPVSIGDKVPDVTINNLLNYKTQTAKLSDFKSQLLILDFWATWCTPCVKSIAEFQVLQQEFDGKVQFVLSTPEEKDKITKFLHDKNIRLPCFVEEKELSLYFPHNSVPHEVWIQNGKVIAITYSNTVTAQNIRKALDSETVEFPEKEFNSSYDVNEPLLAGNNGGDGNDIIFHSVFTHYIPGIQRLGELTDKKGRFKFLVLNGSAAEMYTFAATKEFGIIYGLKNRLLIKAKQKEKIHPLKAPGYAPEVRPYFFCYELILPPAEISKASSFMMEDLNRYFSALYHVRGGIEKIKTKCWVLRKTDKSVSITSKNGISKIEQKDGYEAWQNKPFSDFFYSISYSNQKQQYPFVDKTGITGNVDIRLPLNIKDITALRAYLKKYGLQLSLEESEVSLFVIKNIH